MDGKKKPGINGEDWQSEKYKPECIHHARTFTPRGTNFDRCGGNKPSPVVGLGTITERSKLVPLPIFK